MKKLGTLLLLLSVSMFTVGCKTETEDATTATEEATTATEDAGSGDAGTTEAAPEGDGA